MRTDLRPLDFGEILDTTIRLLRTGWKPLFLTGLISAIPVVLYNGVTLSLTPTPATMETSTSGLFFRAIIGAESGDFTQLFELGGILVFLVLFMLLVNVWTSSTLIVLASRLYLGLPVTAGMAMRIAGRRYFAILGTGLLKLLFLIIAVPVLVIGGLVFLAIFTVPVGLVVLSVFLTFTTVVLVVENAGGGWPAIQRSFRLVGGRFWPLLGLSIIFYLFASVLSGQLAAITQLPAQLLRTFNQNPDFAPALAWIVAVFSGLLTAFTMPLNYVGVTLAYYDTRMRKEGLDLEIMAAGQVTGAHDA
ncbi:MAG TPA: hypothetical protein VNT75_32860 [Symbiobacteriaceae bacterium]|nr:hypothetical protein [Symbiobacteriaceae bacterium]